MLGVVGLMIPMRENSLVTRVSIPDTDPRVLHDHIFPIKTTESPHEYFARGGL